MLAGGALALWAGPKIAPALPSGMAPVAAWLTPGSSRATQEIAQLENRLDARIEALPKGISRDEAGTMIASATDAVSTDLTTRITALSDQLKSTDSADIESRISALETGISGLQAELASLTAQISDVTASGGELTAQTSAQIGTYKAALDGLKAEVARLAAQNGTLSQKIDSVAATAQRQVTEAETKATQAETLVAQERRAATITSALDTVGIALTSGQPFDAALATLSDAGADIPADLSAASAGVPTLAELRAAYPQAAHAALRAAAQADSGTGVFSSIGSFLKSQVATRSLTPQDGPSADAVLSRAEAALKQDNLSTALTELATLPVPSDAMDAWIADATTRLKAQTALTALATALQSE